MKPMNRAQALEQARWLNLAAALLVSGLRGLLDGRVVAVGAAYAAFAVFEVYRPHWADSSAPARTVRHALDLLLAMALVGLTGGFQSPLWWSLAVPGAAAANWLGLPLGAGLSVCGWLATGGVMALASAGTTLDPVRVLWTSVSGLAGMLAVTWLSNLSSTASPSPGPKPAEARAISDAVLLPILDIVSQADESLDLSELAGRMIDLVEAGLGGIRPSARSKVAGLWIGTLDEGAWASTRGFAPVVDRTPPSGRTALLDLWKRGEPIRLDDPGNDSFLGRWAALAACPLVTAIPLRVPTDAPAAAVILGVAPGGPVLAPSAELVGVVAREAGRIWTNATRYQSLLNERERFNELQEEARRRLARNLHDGPTQSIASIAMRANFARRQIARDPKAAAQEIAKVEDMARQITREIRNMLFTLRPLILESQGLGPALYQLALKAREAQEEEINLEIDPEATAGLGPGVQGALFYIVEEAVHNAQKHAAAENIWIRLMRADVGLRLEIEDDGVGFNVGAVDANYEQRGSLGMVNMRERAELAGGSLSVRSTEGQGTCISVALPGPEDPLGEHG
jgi:signal transduction histidine kinase